MATPLLACTVPRPSDGAFTTMSVLAYLDPGSGSMILQIIAGGREGRAGPRQRVALRNPAAPAPATRLSACGGRAKPRYCFPPRELSHGNPCIGEPRARLLPRPGEPGVLCG